MFVLTMTKKRLTAAVIAAGCVLCAIILLVSALGGSEAASTNPGRNIKTNEDRLAFLAGFGWDAAPQPLETQEVLIPREFDDVLTSYNKLQLEQGYDLLKYRGKRVMRYTYEIKNYPGFPEGVRATMLVYKNKVVGGDVCSVDIDGFMHGFVKGG